MQMYSPCRFGVRSKLRILMQAVAFNYRCLANLPQLNVLRVILVVILIPGSNVLGKWFPSFTRFPTFSSTTYLQLAWPPRRCFDALQHFSSPYDFCQGTLGNDIFFMVRALKGSVPQLNTCITGIVQYSHAKNVVNIR